MQIVLLWQQIGEARNRSQVTQEHVRRYSYAWRDQGKKETSYSSYRPVQAQSQIIHERDERLRVDVKS